MRIAVNTRHLISDSLEGIGRYTYETVKKLVNSHPEDTFYFYFDRNYDSRWIFADNIVPKVIKPPARHPILFFLWYEILLPIFFKKDKIDVFYSPDGFLSLRSRVPTLVVTHDLAYLHFPEHLPLKHLWYYRYFVPKFLKRADHIIAVSEYTKEDIRKQFNISSSKVSVAYNSLPERDIDENVNPRDYTHGSPYFIYIGSLHPRKNITGLIESFNIFKKRYQTRHKLILIGRFAWRCDKIRKALQNSPYISDILHLQRVPDRQVYSYIKHADGMLYISLFEGFGIPVIEAMKFSVPVICSNVSSLPEVGGDAAIVVNPHDYHDIAEKMFELVENKNLKEELSVRAKLNLQRFDWQHSADIIYAELVKLVKPNNVV